MSEITAAEILIKTDWDGDILEEEEMVPESPFSLVSILLISMIFLVVLVIAYINRKLLMSKLRKHCLRKNNGIKEPCKHEDSMVAANQSVKKIQESY